MTMNLRMFRNVNISLRYKLLNQQVVGLRHQIGELKDELIKKNREFEGLKLVRKEISERELKNKVEVLEAECEMYRSQAVKLMQKYPGYGETDGMDEEDYHEYRFSNLVLGEYDALLNELVQTLEKVETHRRKREVIFNYVRKRGSFAMIKFKS